MRLKGYSFEPHPLRKNIQILVTYKEKVILPGGPQPPQASEHQHLPLPELLNHPLQELPEEFLCHLPVNIIRGSIHIGQQMVLLLRNALTENQTSIRRIYRISPVGKRSRNHFGNKRAYTGQSHTVIHQNKFFDHFRQKIDIHIRTL